jgi:hypothetical protein
MQRKGKETVLVQVAYNSFAVRWNIKKQAVSGMIRPRQKNGSDKYRTPELVWLIKNLQTFTVFLLCAWQLVLVLQEQRVPVVFLHGISPSTSTQHTAQSRRQATR